MTRSILYLCKRLVAAALPLVLLFSCAKDPEVDTLPQSGDKAMVTVVIKAPGTGTPATRAMTDNDETNVTQIDVLLFEAQNENNNNPNAGKFFYRATSNQIDNSAGARKQFTVGLPVGTYDMVILANARDVVSGINLTNGMKEDILEALTLDLESAPLNLSAPNHHWPVKQPAPAPFPMWGEAGVIEIEDGAIVDNPLVQMLRMVARVDMTVTETNFAILGVDVYNYNTKGTLVPVSTAEKEINGVQGVLVADKPNVPTGAQVTRGPMNYKVSDYISESWTKSFTQNIYLLEGQNLDADTPRALTDRTCLVVKGVWSPTGTEADFADEAKATYYRVDFSYKDASEFLDVIRNKHYTINIKSVKGHGYEDSRIAFESEPANMTTQVVAWDEYMDEVIFDGKYITGITPNRAEFEPGAGTGSFTVKTNAPSWSCEVTYPDGGSAGWVTVTSPDDKNNNTSDVKEFRVEYTVSANNDEDRTAYINITPQGGAVTMVHTVKQEVGTIAHRFARSNIVVKPDGKLTFAITKEDNETIPANVQGLMFRWGSLIGVCDDDPNEPNKNINLNSNSIRFKPEEYPIHVASSTNIPYYQENAYQIEDVFKRSYPELGFNASQAMGDICRYITYKVWVEGNWRMPTDQEYTALIESSLFIANHPGRNQWYSVPLVNEDNWSGVASIPCGYWIGNMETTNLTTPPDGTLFFPGSGYRDVTGFLQYSKIEGRSGDYLTTNSARGETTHFSGAFYVYTNDQTPSVRDASANRFHSIRCIRE